MTEILGVTLPLLLLLAGTAMMLAEAVIPGAQFIVVGVALFVSGLVGVILGGPFASIVTLSVMTVTFAVFAYFAFREIDLYEGPDRGKTSASSDLMGASAIVTERVTNRSGSIRLTQGGGFDPNYRARSEHGEIPEGEEVIITDPGGGNVVRVQTVDHIREDSIDRELARGRDAASAEADAVDDSDTAEADASSNRNDDADGASSTDDETDGSSSTDDEETETERA